MDKETFKKIAHNPNFIPGIYNYCDRWCERCEMTEHCSVFAIEVAEKSCGSATDDENRAFWRQLKSTLETALELVKEIAQNTGIDPNTLVQDEPQASRTSKPGTFEPALVRQAKEYMKSVGRWFDLKTTAMDDGHPLEDATPEAQNLQEIEQIILWYHTLIYVKLARAFLPDVDDQELSGDSTGDADGSAKVALTAMDRSLAAWWKMHGYYPKRKDQIVKLLLRLERLRQETERAFPNARSFIRPGFDEKIG